MPFRRPSEGRAHAVLRCIGLLIVNLGLFAFAVYNVMLLFRYEFFLQSTENMVTADNPWVDFPDVLICSATSSVFSPAMTWFTDNNITRSLQGPNITLVTHDVRDINHNGPCNVQHDLLTVITVNGEKVNRTKYTHLEIPLGMDVFGSNNDSTIQAYIMTLPHENNPYLQDSLTWPVGFEESRDIVDNLYATAHAKQEARLRTTITKTWRRRKDFVGLWGYLEDKPIYSATTQFNSYAAMNQAIPVTRFRVYVPVTSFENSQVLIQTFQSAFSSWGGAFGVAWGFFYFLFGTPRMDPFGFIALYILGRSNKRIIAEHYFAEKKDGSLHHNNKNINSASGLPVSKQSAFSPQDDLESQQKKEQKYRDLEARIVSLEAVLDDFYLDLSLFRKEEEDSSQRAPSWYRRTFSSKAKDEKDGAFVQIEERGAKTSYESESYRMGQMQRDRSA
ncbi:unnamed protein product [Mortierella alpina]